MNLTVKLIIGVASASVASAGGIAVWKIKQSSQNQENLKPSADSGKKQETAKNPQNTGDPKGNNLASGAESQDTKNTAGSSAVPQPGAG